MPFVPAERLRPLGGYLFVEIERKRQAKLAAGRDVIDLGIGDPDQPTPRFIVERASLAVHDPACHRYPSQRGLAALREQFAAFFQERYGVRLDPDRQVLPLIGSKEGLAHLPLAVVNPGQAVLVPEPGYPVYRAAALLAGGEPVSMLLREDLGWLPDLSAVPPQGGGRAALMYLNYPNNPTGAVASRGFFEECVVLARRCGFIIAHDAAYAETYFDSPPPSILQIRGADQVAVEFHSLSKTFNMTGWRIGFAAGSAEVLEALATVKANIDSGIFGAVQLAGAAALAGVRRPEIEKIRRTYRERAEILCAALQAAGFSALPPPATFYVWARVPQGWDGAAVARRLLEEQDLVCVPGIGFGRGGERYVRFALTTPTERIREAAERIGRMRW
jgi:LL-diaminopimelate aminotransferase